jgi:hypothetical protein
MRVFMPLRGRATARNFPKFLDGLLSHIGSCSLEGPQLSRDTPRPGADFLLFFRLGCRQAQSTPGHVLCLHCRMECTNVAAPHTYGGSLDAEATSAETARWSRCDLETYRCPHPVLFNEKAQRRVLSSEGQARESNGLGCQACVA